MSDSGDAALSKRGCAVRHAGLPTMPEPSGALSSAECGGALYSGIPDLPNPSDGILSAAQRSHAVRDAGYAAMSESMRNCGTAAVPAHTGHAVVSQPLRNCRIAAVPAHAGDAVVSQPVRDTRVAELSTDAVFTLLDPWDPVVSESTDHDLYAGHSPVSEPTYRCVHTRNAAVPEFEFDCMHPGHSTVSEPTDPFVHSGNTAMPDDAGYRLSDTRDATVPQSSCAVPHYAGHAAVSLARRARVPEPVNRER